MKKLASALLIGMCFLQPKIYAKEVVNLIVLKSSLIFDKSSKWLWFNWFYREKEDATIAEFSSKGCLTTYTQIGKELVILITMRKREFFNNWYKADAGYFNDMNENFVVFYAKEVA